MNSTYKYEDKPNNDGTRTYTIYKNHEWVASFTSEDGESISDFHNRISKQVIEISKGNLDSKF